MPAAKILALSFSLSVLCFSVACKKKVKHFNRNYQGSGQADATGVGGETGAKINRGFLVTVITFLSAEKIGEHYRTRIEVHDNPYPDFYEFYICTTSKSSCSPSNGAPEEFVASVHYYDQAPTGNIEVFVRACVRTRIAEDPNNPCGDWTSAKMHMPASGDSKLAKLFAEREELRKQNNRLCRAYEEHLIELRDHQRSKLTPEQVAQIESLIEAGDLTCNRINNGALGQAISERGGDDTGLLIAGASLFAVGLGVTGYSAYRFVKQGEEIEAIKRQQAQEELFGKKPATHDDLIERAKKANPNASAELNKIPKPPVARANSCAVPGGTQYGLTGKGGGNDSCTLGFLPDPDDPDGSRKATPPDEIEMKDLSKGSNELSEEKLKTLEADRYEKNQELLNKLNDYLGPPDSHGNRNIDLNKLIQRKGLEGPAKEALDPKKLVAEIDSLLEVDQTILYRRGANEGISNHMLQMFLWRRQISPFVTLDDSGAASYAKKVQMLQLQIQSISGQLADIDSEIGRNVGKADKIEAKMQFLSDGIDKLKNKSKLTEEERTKLGTLKSDLEKAKSDKTQVENALTEEQTKYKELQAANAALASEKASLETKIEDLKGEIGELTNAKNAAVEAKNGLEEKVNTLEQEKKELETAKTEAENAQKKLEGDVDILTTELENANQLKQDAQIKLQEQISKNGELSIQAENARKELEARNSEFAQLQSALESTQTELKTQKELVGQLQDKNKELTTKLETSQRSFEEADKKLAQATIDIAEARNRLGGAADSLIGRVNEVSVILDDQLKYMQDFDATLRMDAASEAKLQDSLNQALSNAQVAKEQLQRETAELKGADASNPTIKNRLEQVFSKQRQLMDSQARIQLSLIEMQKTITTAADGVDLGVSSGAARQVDLASTIDLFSRNIEAINSQRLTQINELEKQLQQEKELTRNLSSQLNDSNAELESTNSQLKKLQQEFEELETRFAELDASKKSEVEQLKQQIKDKQKAIEEKQREINDVTTENRRLQEELRKRSDKSIADDEQIRQLQKEAVKLKKDHAEYIEQQKENFEQRLEEASNKFNEELEKQRKLLEGKTAESADWKNKFEESQLKLKEAEVMRDIWQQFYNTEQERQNKVIKRQKQEISAMQDELEGKEQEIKNLREQLESAKNDHSSVEETLRKELDQKKSEIDKLKRNIDNIKSEAAAKDRARIEKLKKRGKKILQLQDRIKEYKDLKIDLDAQITQLEQELVKEKRRYLKLADDLEAASDSNEELKQQLEQQKQLTQSIQDKYDQEVLDHNATVQKLQEAQAQLRARESEILQLQTKQVGCDHCADQLAQTRQQIEDQDRLIAQLLNDRSNDPVRYRQQIADAQKINNDIRINYDAPTGGGGPPPNRINGVTETSSATSRVTETPVKNITRYGSMLGMPAGMAMMVVGGALMGQYGSNQAHAKNKASGNISGIRLTEDEYDSSKSDDFTANILMEIDAIASEMSKVQDQRNRLLLQIYSQVRFPQ